MPTRLTSAITSIMPKIVFVMYGRTATGSPHFSQSNLPAYIDCSIWPTTGSYFISVYFAKVRFSTPWNQRINYLAHFYQQHLSTVLLILTVIAFRAFSIASLMSGYPNLIKALCICGSITIFVYEQLFRISSSEAVWEVGIPERRPPSFSDNVMEVFLAAWTCDDPRFWDISNSRDYKFFKKLISISIVTSSAVCLTYYNVRIELTYISEFCESLSHSFSHSGFHLFTV